MMIKTTVGSLALCVALAATATEAAELSPAGAQLAIGDSAVVPLRIPYGPQVPARVTVTAIEEGTLADFEGYKLPPAAADMKPYYVRYSVTALGDGNLSGLGLGYTLAVDDRNQLHTSSLPQSNFTGKTFDRCRDSTFKNGAADGTTYQGCRIFMLHKSGSMKAFAFKEFETPYANAPVLWMTGGATKAATTGEATLRLGN